MYMYRSLQHEFRLPPSPQQLTSLSRRKTWAIFIREIFREQNRNKNFPASQKFSLKLSCNVHEIRQHQTLHTLKISFRFFFSLKKKTFFFQDVNRGVEGWVGDVREAELHTRQCYKLKRESSSCMERRLRFILLCIHLRYINICSSYEAGIEFIYIKIK